MSTPNTDSRELDEIELLLNKIYRLGIRHGDKGYHFFDKTNATLVKAHKAILAYTANKQKNLLDSLHREIFSDAGVMDNVEIAKLIRDKKESL